MGLRQSLWGTVTGFPYHCRYPSRYQNRGLLGDFERLESVILEECHSRRSVKGLVNS